MHTKCNGLVIRRRNAIAFKVFRQWRKRSGSALILPFSTPVAAATDPTSAIELIRYDSLKKIADEMQLELLQEMASIPLLI